MSLSDSLADLAGAPVRVGTVRLGEVVGVLVDHGSSRALGLEVAGVGGVRRFLPWVAARFGPGSVSVDSALLLMDDGGSYERRGAVAIRDLTALRGLRASPAGLLQRVEPVSATVAAGIARR